MPKKNIRISIAAVLFFLRNGREKETDALLHCRDILALIVALY
jgi:hypothetical protein